MLKMGMPKSPLATLFIGGTALLLVIGVLSNGGVQPKEQLASSSSALPEQESSSGVAQKGVQPASDAPSPTTSPQEGGSSAGGYILQQTPQEVQPGPELATVTLVVDGDTVEIHTGDRVRLIGIDTPERGNSYYTEARNKLSELVLNKQVQMEKDISEKDRYERLLRYLYVGNLFVNLEMVKQGYASAYTYPPDVQHSAQFLAAEQEARNKKVGLWTPTQPESPQPTQEASYPSFTIPPCAQIDCDCAHFSTHAHAQWFYENYDPSNKHRLDGDKDGIACESLP